MNGIDGRHGSHLLRKWMVGRFRGFRDLESPVIDNRLRKNTICSVCAVSANTAMIQVEFLTASYMSYHILSLKEDLGCDD